MIGRQIGLTYLGSVFDGAWILSTLDLERLHQSFCRVPLSILRFEGRDADIAIHAEVERTLVRLRVWCQLLIEQVTRRWYGARARFTVPHSGPDANDGCR